MRHNGKSKGWKATWNGRRTPSEMPVVSLVTLPLNSLASYSLLQDQGQVRIPCSPASHLDSASASTSLARSTPGRLTAYLTNQSILP